MNGLIRFLDSMLTWASTMSREAATSFCELETVDHDGKTLVASDGSLATIIDVQGSSRLVGAREYARTVEKISNQLQSFMKSPGHTLQVYWVRDPDGSPEIVKAALAGARNQANLLKLDFSDILDEQERELSKWICHEAVYFVCWTHPGVLTPAEGKAARATQDRENEALGNLNFSGAQSPRVLLSSLRNRHSAFVSSLLSAMGEVDIVASQMDVHTALRAVRSSVDSTWTPPSWKPTVPGDRIPAKFPIRSTETSAVWWPPLASQVWPRDAKVLEGDDENLVRIGDRVHAPMYVEIPGVRQEPFDVLIERAIKLDRRMPFSVSFVVKGGGLEGLKLKQTIASVFAVFSAFNAQIRDAMEQLKELSVSESIISFQVAFDTWAPVGETNLLRERASRMAQAMIDWGGAEVRQATGDPVEGFTSSALALAATSIAEKAAAPLADVVPMFPLTRPASPWTQGAEIFTSEDGKMMPYQPGSSVQTTWTGIFVGGPGSGKSMQMFKQHRATILAPQGGITKIPQIKIIDIGPSSSGLVSMLKHALPPNEQHYVSHHRLRNTAKYAFNPCDLPMGLEYPLPEQRAFLIDFLTMLATPAETGLAYEGTAELAGLVVDEMYKKNANNERGQPVAYSAGFDLVVDEAIANNGLTLPARPSWYDVRDVLFRAGRVHEAYLAARYAVPTISDAASAARSDAVRSIYDKKLTQGEGSETLPEAFNRMIQASVREYLVLSQPTKFDIGESRVTIFDLDEVAKGGGPAGGKQTAVMYALSLYMLTRSFSMTKDSLDDIPPEYRDYHYATVVSNEKELKTICCDEFHRTPQTFSGMLREQFKVIAREGRKWKVQLMLASQSLGHFDDDLIDLATSIFLMDRPDGALVDQYVKRFGLSETERHALASKVKAPRAGGGTFFVRMKTKEGHFNQLLRNPAGPIELWAGSTTSEDKSIREMVYTKLGPVAGRAALALSYPGGSAQTEAEQRKAKMALRGESLVSGAEDDLFTQMASEVVSRYQKFRADELKGETASHQATLSRDRGSAVAH